MTLAQINVADSFKKGEPKQIYINVEAITAIEKQNFGVAGGYRIVLSTPGSATPPKEGAQYPKSFFEPFSYAVTEAQGLNIIAQINAVRPILDWCVDGAGNAPTAASAAAPAATSGLGF